ncbi:helix-turn-helix transcriptional regulator [Paraneptunicella aestuarii]|uniref:helix-turn-helix transcriptional regulator n=1 Tax=Paraneptunicella aestuarii TaxID=2831148 RepID=UPI001E34461B|nr:helix-turn-helix transcriptional regulator [Paraneptunicella aestuarii]UAA37392.1 helix-turn-helix transcriptional regulator [Paraneptunicella aestuarii]
MRTRGEIPSLVISGSDLKKMRLVFDKTTQDMATAAGLRNRKTYENWEKGISAPNVNQFFALAKACGLTPSEVVSIMISTDKKEVQLCYRRIVENR